MLKRIPAIISSDLMKCMMDMGHSDLLLLADANYPAATNARKLIHMEGVEIPDLLRAVIGFFHWTVLFPGR